MKSTQDSNQSLRGSLMQRDEKRIQFNLDDEKMELQVFLLFRLHLISMKTI